MFPTELTDQILFSLPVSKLRSFPRSRSPGIRRPSPRSSRTLSTLRGLTLFAPPAPKPFRLLFEFMGPATSLRPFLDPIQLVLPQPFERLGPLVQWPDCFRVRSIKHMPPVPPYAHQTDVPQHPQMLRHRRLLHAQAHHDVPDRPLLQRQIVQDFPPPRLSHRIKRIRGCRRSCQLGELYIPIWEYVKPHFLAAFTRGPVQRQGYSRRAPPSIQRVCGQRRGGNHRHAGTSARIGWPSRNPLHQDRHHHQRRSARIEHTGCPKRGRRIPLALNPVQGVLCRPRVGTLSSLAHTRQ